MSENTSSMKAPVDAQALREQVKSKYREVATSPEREFHFHTGRPLTELGSGAGFDCFVASALVTDEGEVVGVDMTPEMLSKAKTCADAMSLENVEFREGLLEELPVADGWADVAISNGVINLCSDKRKVISQIHRVLKPGGYLQFADIANSKPVPQAAIGNIDLWTA